MKAIPYGYHWLDEEDIASVIRALRGPWITQGPLVDRFEEKVAAAAGARFAVAFSSGTAALHAACSAAGLGPGDEAVTTPMTFVATSNAVLACGAAPVFADIEAATLNLDPEQIPRRLSPKTKALLPVHFAGLPCRMERIREIADRRGLLVIEDACHALGAQWRSSAGRWEKIGSCSHSDMTVFSFHPVKHISTGEGGMVLTHREDFRDRLRRLRHHGMSRTASEGDSAEEPWCQQMQEMGFNYRITDFQCALGLSQMDKLERFLERRRQIAERYLREFAGLGLLFQEADPARTRHAWHLFAVRLPLESLRMDRKAAYRLLRRKGLGVNVHYLPVHLQPFYRKRFSYRPGAYPEAERYYDQALTLPLFPRMTEQETDTVIRCVHEMFEEALACNPCR